MNVIAKLIPVIFVEVHDRLDLDDDGCVSRDGNTRRSARTHPTLNPLYLMGNGTSRSTLYPRRLSSTARGRADLDDRDGLLDVVRLGTLHDLQKVIH